MKIIKILLTLALINALSSAPLLEEEYKSRLEKYYKDCANFKFRSLREIAEDIDERRADRDNHFFGEYPSVFRWFSTKHNNRMIEASRGPTAVTIIYIIVVGLVMIALLLAILKVFKTKGSRICLILAVICWIAYSCFFWAALTL